MSIRDTFHRLAEEVHGVRQALAGLNDEVDRAAEIEFTRPDPRLAIAAPASFTPLPPAPLGSPTNPLGPGDLFGPTGLPIRNRTTSTGNRDESSSVVGSGSQFTLADNPLIPSWTPGAMLMYKSDLDGLVARGVCQLMELPSGSHVVSCPWGIYPGDNGVLAITSGRSSGGHSGSSGGAARDRFSSDIVGLADPGFSQRATLGGPAGGGGTGGGGSRSGAASSVNLDSRPITDRLDGLRSDVQQMARALAGDGGAGIRFKGGL